MAIQIFLEKKLKVGDKIFFTGMTTISETELATFGENVLKQVVIIPPGTVPHGIQWYDKHFHLRTKWVAYVE